MRTRAISERVVRLHVGMTPRIADELIRALAVMAELNDYNRQLLQGARYGEVDEVQAALDSGSSVNASGLGGSTGLHMASANGHEDIVTLLVDRGATVDTPNDDGNTALHWGCLNSQIEVCRILLKSGASPTTVNRSGRTPLDEALQSSNSALVELVKSFGPSEPQQNGAELAG